MNELELKAIVRERDDCRCTRCGMTRAEHFAKYDRDLDVHRLEPGVPYTVQGCIAVCKACHGKLPKLPRGELTRRRMEQGLPTAIRRIIDADVRDAVDLYIETQELEPTLTTILELALKEFLAKRGGWPVPSKFRPRKPKGNNEDR